LKWFAELQPLLIPLTFGVADSTDVTYMKKGIVELRIAINDGRELVIYLKDVLFSLLILANLVGRISWLMARIS